MSRIRRLPILVLLLVFAGCSQSAASPNVVRYERDWPDSYHEELIITDDGHVTMKHGDVLERLTLTAAQVREVQDLLAAGVPRGDLGDSVVRTVVLASGTSVSPVQPIPGSAVALLETLMTKHSLNGAPVPGTSGQPLHAHGASGAP